MKTLTILLVAFFLSGNGFTQPTHFIHVKGKQLLDSTGKPVYLNGVNLGGWLLWEGWITGGGFTKETTVKERLKELLGNEIFHQFIKAYYTSFIREKDIALIAKHGFNSIRLPFNYRLFETQNDSGIDGFAIVDSMVNWCRKYNLYLVLDMHAAPGGQSQWFIADPSNERLWGSEENQLKTLQLWAAIAKKYQHETIIAGYDLLNEPDVNKAATLISFYKDLIKAIRATDPNHLLIAEGNKLAHNFKEFPALLDDNQVYSYHYYPWFSEHNKTGYLKSITENIKSDLPLWCGEWGEDNPDNLREIKTLMNSQDNLCGTAFWTWKRVYKNNDRKPFNTISLGKNWEKIMWWVTWKMAKPNKEQVQKGVEDFLQAIRIENCTMNEEVKAAIIK